MKKIKMGFTLIEILVVVLIISILAGVALPQYRKVTLKAQYARAKQTAADLRRAYEFYYSVHNDFPTKLSDLDFSYKFDESAGAYTGNGYYCGINTVYNEISCRASKDEKILYLINFYSYTSKKITEFCIAMTQNTNDVYHKICQEETCGTGPCDDGGRGYYTYH